MNRHGVLVLVSLLSVRVAMAMSVDNFQCAELASADDAVSRRFALNRCAVELANAGCAAGEPRALETLSSVSGVSILSLRKTLGRQSLRNGEFTPFCNLPIERREAFLNSAAFKKSPRDEANREFLQDFAGFENGKPPDLQLALLQRQQIVDRETRKRSSTSTTLAVDTIYDFHNITGTSHPVGRVNDLYIDPAQPSRMFAGTDGGGIWLTTTSGSSWLPVSDSAGSLSIANIVAAANDTLTIYAATNPVGSHTFVPGGVLKSIDGGQTWLSLASTNPVSNPDWTYVTRIAVSPANSAKLLAAVTNSGVSGGVYSSSDAGLSWTKLSLNASSAGTWVTFHPSDPNRQAVMYADGAIFLTVDGGASWTLSRPLPIGDIQGSYGRVAYAASDSQRLYALLNRGGSITELHMSTNAGQTWRQVQLATGYDQFTVDSGYLYYTGALWVDPTNAERVGVGEQWFGITDNVSATTPSWKRSVIGWADSHGIIGHPQYDGVANRTVFLVDDGGIYKHTDVLRIDEYFNPNPYYEFTSFLAPGITPTQVYQAAGSDTALMMGAQDVGLQGYVSTNSSSNREWRQTQFADGNLTFGDGVAIASGGGTLLYGATQRLRVLRSDDGGRTVASICGDLGDGACASNYNANFNAPLVVDQTNTARVYVGGFDLWRTHNATVSSPSWANIRGFSNVPPAPGGVVSGIAIHPANPDTVWVIRTNGLLYRSDNATSDLPTWTTLNSGQPAVSSGTQYLFVDRNNPNRLFVASPYANRLPAVSTNGGASFQRIGTFPAIGQYAVEVHPGNPRQIFVGTGVGLFYSDDNGATWKTSNVGPGSVRVTSLQWVRSSRTTAGLLIGTFGRGVWTANVRNTAASVVCDIDINGDGRVSAAADGMLFLRYLLGVRGDALPANMPVATSLSHIASRVRSAEVTQYLDSLTASNLLDLDGDGKTMALTDGLVLLRTMLGLTGTAVTSGIYPPGSEPSWSAIQLKLFNSCGVRS